MSTESDTARADACARLGKAINDLNVRIRVSEQNIKLRESYEEKSGALKRSVQTLNRVVDIMKPMLEDTQQYAAKRRQESMQNINNALRLAGEIIPDSTEGIYFRMDGDEAWLSTPDELDVDDVEGGGYRQISSTFLRSIVLTANDKTLDTMFLDEVFSLVSPENTAVLSLYLNVICQDKQVISIEQKPQIYSNINCVQYNFSANADYAAVTKNLVKHGGETDEIQTA